MFHQDELMDAPVHMHVNPHPDNPEGITPADMESLTLATTQNVRRQNESQSYFATTTDEVSTVWNEAETEMDANGNLQPIDYSNFERKLTETHLEERGVRWWTAAYNGYIDYRDNFQHVKNARNALEAIIDADAATDQDTEQYYQHNIRLTRMYECRPGGAVWNQSGLNPDTFGPNVSVQDFLEVGFQQLRLELHRELNDATDNSIGRDLPIRQMF